MAVAKMLHFDLFGLHGDLPAFIDTLQRTAVTQVETVKDEIKNSEFMSSETRIDREIGDMERLLAFFDRVLPRRPNFIEQFAGVKTVLTEEQFRAYAGDVHTLGETAARADGIESEMATLAARQHELEKARAQLQSWSVLALTGEELEGSKHVRVVLGVVDPEHLPSFQTAWREAEPRAILWRVSEDGKEARVVLLWPRESRLDPVLEDPSFSPVTLPKFSGSVGLVIAGIEASLEGIRSRLAGIDQEGRTLAESRPCVEARLDFLRSELAKLNAAKNIAATKYAFALAGWVPARRLGDLGKALDGLGRPHALVTRDPLPEEDVPVELENRGPIVPFEALVQSFSYPKYGEVDPTPVTAPFFFIFFGFCISDAGYGLVLTLFCLGLLKWLKMGPAGKKLAKLFIFGGIGATIAGLLTGGIFGDLFGYRGAIDPVNNALIMMGIALGLGVIQLFLGTILAAVPSLRAGQWRDALYNQGVWLLFLSSLMLLLGQEPLGLKPYGAFLKWLAIASTLGVVYGGTRGRRGILGRLLGIPAGLYSVYNSIGFFSDILSYVRLMALGLAGGVMAAVINLFVRMAVKAGPLGLVAAALIGVFGHALNMALAILGAYVHSSRLQFLEFFSKFYEGGGRPFRALRLERKRVFVVKQREA